MKDINTCHSFDCSAHLNVLNSYGHSEQGYTIGWVRKGREAMELRGWGGVGGEGLRERGGINGSMGESWD